jgi:UDP-N-acetylglucosamine 4,6-dehydratase/5-epimerase
MKCEKTEKFFNNAEILITGGSGSLGNAITRLLCEKYQPKGIRIFSRGECKQKEMKVNFSHYKTPVSYLLGDIRDQERLNLALRGVDYVIHAAALKDIVKCACDPIEAIKTNITGTKNVILACIENNVRKCMLISTDKAVYPVNLYGETKGIAEKLFIHSNIYSPHGTKFSVCRYGNVIGSSGSVIHLFRDQKQKDNVLKVTSDKMTRFWIKIEDVAEFVLNNLAEMKGKEIFIPKMRSIKIIDLAKLFCDNNTKIEEIGIREKEKLHECLITNEESVHAKITDDKYIISDDYYNPIQFTYSSNDVLMNIDELKEKIKEFL